jgi:nitroreductase
MKPIFQRRSIRKFIEKPVDKKIIDLLLKAAMNAPSAGNEQPWEFVVIDDRAILNQIPQFHPYAAMTTQAPVAIVVCADENKFNHGEFWIQDCSAASENILLEITEQGLGGVWVGIYPKEDRVKGLKELLNLPENIIPFSLIPFGYAGEEKKENDRSDKSRIHYNQW